MNKKNKRYSRYIIPLMLFIDLAIINSVIYFISDHDFLNIKFLIFINLFWLISSYFTSIYNFFRNTIYFNVLKLLALQFAVFFLGFFAYFAVFREGEIINQQGTILSAIFINITVAKFLFIFSLKKYRALGGNYRKIIVLGSDNTTKKVIEIVENKKDFGYDFKGFFSNKESKKKKHLGTVKDSFKYMLKEGIDEVFCSLSELTNSEIKEVKKYSKMHDITIKLIPNASELYNKNIVIEFYDDAIVLLKVKELPFEFIENRITKRLFDIFFSFFIIVFILTWLIPLLGILIKLESKGSLFFKQKRIGLNRKEFFCYKFRSMSLNNFSDTKQVSSGDERITNIGYFIRKTSIDEFPQFYNVLKGDMSIVGPRPHMNKQSIKFENEINNYFKRHAVKPGITGIAQIRGYRGEIKKKLDIENRVRLDVFYIENWTFLLDIKIIIRTIINIIKGDEKAY